MRRLESAPRGAGLHHDRLGRRSLFSCRRARRLSAGCRRAPWCEPRDGAATHRPARGTPGRADVRKLPSGYRLTEAGEEVLELANQMEASSQQLETRVFGRDQSVRGLLRVTLAPPLATHLLMPDFADFARLHRDIEMDILSSGELANLTNREADVAIRVV